jgi:hypothetical protein
MQTKRTGNGMDCARLVAREKYLWPGAYLAVLVTDDGGLLCPYCVRSEYRQIYEESKWDSPGSGWKPAGITGTHEMECFDEDGNVLDIDDFVTPCDHCGRNLFDL